MAVAGGLQTSWRRGL